MQRALFQAKAAKQTFTPDILNTKIPAEPVADQDKLII